MAVITITYNRKANNGNGGWSSFHSFNPECMVAMNSNMYTFKDGELYVHHSNSSRNEYYGTSYNSILTLIFNDEYNITKTFKTIELDSTDTWQADISTDLSVGVIEPEYYKLKEGSYYSYIRRDPDTIDTRAVSTQGVGTVGSYSALTITFGFTIGASISTGDKVYISNSGLTLVGTIVSHTSTEIVVDAAAQVPVAGDFIVVVKDSTAESFEPRGYYMEVQLTNDNTEEVELFSVSTEVSKSSP